MADAGRHGLRWRLACWGVGGQPSYSFVPPLRCSSSTSVHTPALTSSGPAEGVQETTGQSCRHVSSEQPNTRLAWPRATHRLAHKGVAAPLLLAGSAPIECRAS